MMNAPFGMATRFEYRHRFLILALIYLSTYALYNVDRMNIVVEMAHLNRTHWIPLHRQVFSFAALVAGMGVALWTWPGRIRQSKVALGVTILRAC
jgi:hypothetical protein